jgi:uridine kinase
MNKMYNQDEIATNLLRFCLPKYKFIYISGNGGSGKTTFSKILVDQLTSMSVGVNCIDMDEFVLDTKMRKSAQKKWVDEQGNNRNSEYTTSFKESYYLSAPEVIVHSIENGLNCFYKPKKINTFIEVFANNSITIIEGVGSAFLEKNNNAIGLFFMCDEDVEVNRRIQRARDGESLLDYEDVKKKATERNEQFRVNILPNKSKFDIELHSMENFELSITKDGLGIFK